MQNASSVENKQNVAILPEALSTLVSTLPSNSCSTADHRSKMCEITSNHQLQDQGVLAQTIPQSDAKIGENIADADTSSGIGLIQSDKQTLFNQQNSSAFAGQVMNNGRLETEQPSGTLPELESRVIRASNNDSLITSHR